MCRIRIRLLKLLNDAILAESDAVRHLAEIAGLVAGGKHGDFAMINKHVGETKQTVKDVKEMYDRHVKEHGC